MDNLTVDRVWRGGKRLVVFGKFEALMKRHRYPSTFDARRSQSLLIHVGKLATSGTLQDSLPKSLTVILKEKAKRNEIL